MCIRDSLHTVRRPISFADLKTVDREECEIFREACQRCVLLEDDQHWNLTLFEASLTGFRNNNDLRAVESV